MGADTPSSGTDRDELLSVYEVARVWGTGIPVVLEMLNNGQLFSLDRGLLIDAGDFTTPVIRRSWVEAFQQGTPGAGRIIAAPDGEPVHPAVEPAFDFHSALDLGDAGGLYAASSLASQLGRTPEELLDAWLDLGSELLAENSGVATSVYSLAPFDAVGVRIVIGATTMPRAVTKPAPVVLLGLLPLVDDPEGWRVDLPLFERAEELTQLLGEAPPELG